MIYELNYFFNFNTIYVVDKYHINKTLMEYYIFFYIYINS